MDDRRTTDERRPGSDRRPTGEPVETAEFAPSRVGGRRGRSWAPALIAVWIVVLVAVAGAGTIGRTLDGSAGGGGLSRPSVTGVPIARGSAAVGDGAVGPPPAGPIRTSDPDPMAYTVARGTVGLEITGTVLVRSVVWVFISVQDPAGDVLTWQSLSIGDQNNDLRLDHAPAFDVEVPLRAALATGDLIVEVNAYNNLGRKIGSVRETFAGDAGNHPIRMNTRFMR